MGCQATKERMDPDGASWRLTGAMLAMVLDLSTNFAPPEKTRSYHLVCRTLGA